MLFTIDTKPSKMDIPLLLLGIPRPPPPHFGQWNADKSNVCSMHVWLLKHPKLSFISSSSLFRPPSQKLRWERCWSPSIRGVTKERGSRSVGRRDQQWILIKKRTVTVSSYWLWGCLLEQLSLIILMNVVSLYRPKLSFNFSLSLMEFIDNLLYCNKCTFAAPDYNSKEIVMKVHKTEQSHGWEFVSEK